MANLPKPEQDDLPSWGFRLGDDLENEIDKINQAANPGADSAGFSVSTAPATKSLNVSTANTAAVANVLATLIKALRNKGILA